MKQLLAILMIGAGLSLSLNAQEHRRQPTVRPTATPAPVANDDSGWVRFNSTAGRFSVLVPQIPPEQTKTEPSEHGPYTSHLFITRDDRNVYAIAWVDYDPSFNFDRRAELEANRDNFVKGVNGTLTSSQSLNIDNYPVIEFTAETTDRTFISRVYLVGRRPYQIAIGFPKGEDDTVVVNRFFNSFKVSR